MLATWIFIVLQWFPLTTQVPFDKYTLPGALYITTWFLWSYFIGRYQPLRKQVNIDSKVKLFHTSVIVLLVFQILIFIYFLNQYSNKVLYTVTAGEFIINYFLLTIYFSYRYAIEYSDVLNQSNEKKIEHETIFGTSIDEESQAALYSKVETIAGYKGLDFLKNQIDLINETTFVYASKNPDISNFIPQQQINSIVQLEKLNNIRGINKLLNSANQILSNDGTFVCCFESKSTYKQLKLRKLPIGINYTVYAFDFLFKRVFPKLSFSSYFYYIFSGCKNRILSKAEVLGRLYCCGYSVENVKKIGNLIYVVSKRVKEPELNKRQNYGPLIRLKRFGKNGKQFEVYKVRTMHPYSEYLQSYIFEKNNLQDGGKFNKDIRITTIGKLMRKYWLDELPMILNLLKGEMKLVGVRPLSKQYFSLYSKELQEKRLKFKPGLLPPFYADMPKTLEEIQLSEMQYLTLCENSSEILTDLHYLFLILKNILIKKARSA
jgi:lipopolysaccharide/colanic/teichoic acid biosynthesis glycosyltransferase